MSWIVLWLSNWRTTTCGFFIFLLSTYEFWTGLQFDHVPFDPLAHFVMSWGFVFAKDAQLPQLLTIFGVRKHGDA